MYVLTLHILIRCGSNISNSRNSRNSISNSSNISIHQHTFRHHRQGGGVMFFGEGVSSPTQTFTDGFAIQLDILPDPKRSYVQGGGVEGLSLSPTYISPHITMCACVVSYDYISDIYVCVLTPLCVCAHRCGKTPPSRSSHTRGFPRIGTQFTY